MSIRIIREQERNISIELESLNKRNKFFLSAGVVYISGINDTILEMSRPPTYEEEQYDFNGASGYIKLYLKNNIVEEESIMDWYNLKINSNIKRSDLKVGWHDDNIYDFIYRDIKIMLDDNVEMIAQRCRIVQIDEDINAMILYTHRASYIYH